MIYNNINFRYTMKILVTGRNGFLAKYINNILLDIYADDFAVDFYSYMTDDKESKRSIERYDWLIDIGSPTPLTSDPGGKEFLAHLNRVNNLHSKYSFKSIILTSSVRIFKDFYNDKSLTFSEDSEIDPNCEYGLMKLSIENLHRSKCKNVTSYILGAMCGKSMNLSFIGNTIRKVKEGKNITLNGKECLFNGCYLANEFANNLINNIRSNRFIAREIIHSSNPILLQRVVQIIGDEVGKEPLLSYSNNKSSSKIFQSNSFIPRFTTEDVIKKTVALNISKY